MNHDEKNNLFINQQGELYDEKRVDWTSKWPVQASITFEQPR